MSVQCTYQALAILLVHKWCLDRLRKLNKMQKRQKALKYNNNYLEFKAGAFQIKKLHTSSQGLELTVVHLNGRSQWVLYLLLTVRE